MSDISTNQSYVSQPKWQTIISSVFGFITIIPLIEILFIRTSGGTLGYILGLTFFFFYFSGWLFGATAFILGIKGLKYRKNAFAIAAIVLSALGFISNIYLYHRLNTPIPLR